MNRRLFPILFVAGVWLLAGCKRSLPANLPGNFPTTVKNPVAILLTDSIAGENLNITSFFEAYTPDTAIKKTGMDPDYSWKRCGDSIWPNLLWPDRTCWLRLTARNGSRFNFKQLVGFGQFDKVDWDLNGYEQKAGELTALTEWSYPENNHFFYLVLAAGQTKTFYLRCHRFTTNVTRSMKFTIRSVQSEQADEAFEIRSRMTDTLFLFFYLGFLFFCFTYFLAQYFYRLHDHILLVYSLYILFMFMYSFRDIDKHYFLQTTFSAFNGINIWGEAVFSYLAYIFYSLFVLYLLPNLKKNTPTYRFSVAAIGLLALLLALDIILRVNGQEELALRIFVKTRILFVALLVYYFMLLIPLRKGHFSYFFAGASFLLLGVVLNQCVYLTRNNASFVFHPVISSPYGFWSNPANYTRLGIFMEMLFFSLGLAKKMRMEFVEATMREDSAIENRFYLHEVRSGLSTLRLKLSEPGEADKYLNDFRAYLSKALNLMRDKTGISLSSEIEMINHYFNLQKDNDQVFEFSFENRTAIDPASIMLPAGLTIPFVQNYFEHGSTTGEDATSRFEMTLYEDNKQLCLKAIDNGPGPGTTNIFKKTGSSGLDIARRKVNLFNVLTGSRLDFSVENRKDGTGTIVTIINLPKKN